jgi:hypothetical protein
VNVVFLSPHFPPNHFLSAQRLRDHDWTWWRKMLPHDLERLGA